MADQLTYWMDLWRLNSDEFAEFAHAHRGFTIQIPAEHWVDIGRPGTIAVTVRASSADTTKEK